MKWFYDLKIQAKLLVSFGFVMILLIFLGLFSELSISSMNSKTQEISGNRIQALTILADMNNNISSHRRQELQHIMSTTAEMEQYEKAMNNCVEIIKKDEVTYKPLIASDEGRKLYNDFTEAWKKYTDISQGVIVFSRQNQNEEAKALVRGESKARYDELLHY
jgi:CHASE3 domain sensor protein